MIAETVTVGTENTALDLLIWRRHRRPIPGYLETVLEANIGLAAVVDFLPVGTEVFFPAVDDDEVLDAADSVYLWD